MAEVHAAPSHKVRQPRQLLLLLPLTIPHLSRSKVSCTPCALQRSSCAVLVLDP